MVNQTNYGWVKINKGYYKDSIGYYDDDVDEKGTQKALVLLGECTVTAMMESNYTYANYEDMDLLEDHQHG